MLLIMLLLAIHLLAAVFWVGGMSFAYMVLRPAAGGLDPVLRLPLWRRVFARFLPWVGVSVVADLDYLPHQCIYAPPPGGAPLRLRFLDVRLHLRYQGPNRIDCHAQLAKGEGRRT